MKLKSSIIALLLLTCATGVDAKAPAIKYVPGADLTLVGKVKETPDRYARVDTVAYTGFTDYQRRKLNQQSAGLALAFTTDSKSVWADIKYKEKYGGSNTMHISGAGVDLYIKRDGKWVYAGSTVQNAKNDPINVVADMAPGTKECLLYLPLFSIVDEIYVGVDSAANIKAMDNPFKGKKVVFFGSSFTHGTSTSRAGMAYPLQLQRETGLDVRALGMSGNSKLQQSYARLLADSEADAYVIDAFSNPSPEEIEKNFASFVKTIRAKHPTTPIIFQQTIYRERRNFNTKVDSVEAAKMVTARKVVTKAMKDDPNIYFIIPSTGTDGVTSVDGIHPDDMGYWRWMQSIKQPILNILNK
jgi:lysophospholipase L1-like esterase